MPAGSVAMALPVSNPQLREAVERWQDASDPDNRGVNGLGGGGGGGGGSRGNQNNASDTPSGHAGGSGTVIVRWRSRPESAILVETEAPAGGFRRGTFAGTVTSAGGAGATRRSGRAEGSVKPSVSR